MSTLLTPIIRTNVSYAAAFGLPSVLLAIATCVFVSGRKRYRRLPPTGSVVASAFGALLLALRRLVSSWTQQRHSRVAVAHWLDRSTDKYGARAGEVLCICMFFNLTIFFIFFSLISC